MELKIDFHVHSNRSADGRSDLSQLIHAAKEQGLDGFALADHDLLSQGSEQDGFLIIPACECSTSDGHILGLFLSHPPAVLKAETGQLPTAGQAVDEIHRLGGLAVWAHPYQRSSPVNTEAAAMCDGIETANARACFKNARANEQAAALAARLEKPCLGGSDAHHHSEVGNAFTLVTAEEKSLDALRCALAAGNVRPLLQHNTPRIKKGLSQLHKRRRAKAGPIRLYKAYLYLFYCMILDLIKE